MVITNLGKAQLTLAMTGSMGNQPQYLGIGTGSGTVLTTASGLYSEVSPRVIWTSRDISTSQQINFSFDKSSTAMSGISLTEFLIGGSLAIDSSDGWSIENFDAVVFDGTIEAQVEVLWNVY